MLPLMRDEKCDSLGMLDKYIFIFLRPLLNENILLVCYV